MHTEYPGQHNSFPTFWLGIVIRVYELLWHLSLPAVFYMLWARGSKEPLYRSHWKERFGAVSCSINNPVWIHCASLGEMRGAAPWIHALIKQGTPIFLSTLTPAGRKTAQTLFGEAIKSNQLEFAYAPLELSWAVRRFIKHVNPRCAVMTEIDTWPVLLSTIRRTGIPLAMANAQYPQASFERDQKWGGFRAKIFQAYELVMCKSQLQATRFRAVGCKHVEVVGETRFDLPVSKTQVQSAEQTLENGKLSSRPTICFASAIVGEDEIFIRTMHELQRLMVEYGQPAPLFIYVPRSPQRFEAVNQLLVDAGLKTIRRSQTLDENLQWSATPQWSSVDVLLGDSIGEMYFYLALSQVVVVGSSFGNRAVHNIIEPLAIHKPVWTGPSVRGIEYPAIEALQAGVLHHAQNAEDLANQLAHVLVTPASFAALVEKTLEFNKAHAGSVTRHMAAFWPWLRLHEAK